MLLFNLLGLSTIASHKLSVLLVLCPCILSTLWNHFNHAKAKYWAPGRWACEYHFLSQFTEWLDSSLQLSCSKKLLQWLAMLEISPLPNLIFRFCPFHSCFLFISSCAISLSYLGFQSTVPLLRRFITQSLTFGITASGPG